MNAARRRGVPGFVAAVSLTLGASLSAADFGGGAAAWERHRARSNQALLELSRAEGAPVATGEDAIELSFSEFFEPVADAGLTYTARLQSLAGQRVRITGYMRRESRRQRGVFVLIGRPSVAADGSCGGTEVLPAAVHVHLAGPQAGRVVPFQPGRLVVAGVLEVGSRQEEDGTRSVVRIRADAPRAHAEAAAKPGGEFP